VEGAELAFDGCEPLLSSLDFFDTPQPPIIKAINRIATMLAVSTARLIALPSAWSRKARARFFDHVHVSQTVYQESNSNPLDRSEEWNRYSGARLLSKAGKQADEYPKGKSTTERELIGKC
jgi:hypothetical protein